MFCKQLFTSGILSGGDPSSKHEQENIRVNSEDGETDYYAGGPGAPLLGHDAAGGEGAKEVIRKRHAKVLALERAKHKAAAQWKALPHKARRKLHLKGAAHMPKKTLAYAGAAAGQTIRSGAGEMIRSVAGETMRSIAGGLGSIGTLFNAGAGAGTTARKRFNINVGTDVEELKTSETWPDALQAFLESRSAVQSPERSNAVKA